jgi:1-acyl-sn-glycerol-3-phosphate acyltransferase
MRILRWASITTIRVLVRLFLKVRAVGLERVPSFGPVILAINHINSLDAFVVKATVPRDVIGWAKVELWQNPVLRPFARAIGTIPLRRGELDLQSVRMALQLLKQGKVLGIAPEGTRSWHGRLQQGHPGIVFLALRAPETVILPAALYGQERFTHNLLRLRRTEVTIVFGQCLQLDPGDERVTRENRQQMTDEIMAQIAVLLPADYRGVYSDLETATKQYLRFVPNTRGKQPALSGEAAASSRNGA